MPDVAAEAVWRVTQVRSSRPEPGAQLGQGVGDHVPEPDALERVPEALRRVQRGRVGRQQLEVQTLGRTLGQEVLDDVGSVDRRAIPDD
jgi:hypothetical protein